MLVGDCDVCNEDAFACQTTQYEEREILGNKVTNLIVVLVQKDTFHFGGRGANGRLQHYK